MYYYTCYVVWCSMVLARVVIHVLARVLPHMLARVLLHVLARVIIHVHDYYSKTCLREGWSTNLTLTKTATSLSCSFSKKELSKHDEDMCRWSLIFGNLWKIKALCHAPGNNTFSRTNFSGTDTGTTQKVENSREFSGTDTGTFFPGPGCHTLIWTQSLAGLSISD